MTGIIPDIIKQASRDLRNNMTKSEEKIWNELKNKKFGYKFLRQKPIYLYTENSGLDRYIIPDFCCLELKLILEIDGSVHNEKEIYELDLEKEKLLIQKGFKVLRIRNDEIENNIQLSLQKIAACLTKK